MHAYVISGNKDILQNMSEGLDSTLGLTVATTKETFLNVDNTIFFSDDFSIVEILNDTDDLSFILTVHDKEHPVDAKTGWFFNEFRDTRPVEFYCDVFMEKDDEDAVETMNQLLSDYLEVKKVLNEIQSGDFAVRFDKFRFGAGREPDTYVFGLFKGDTKVGFIYITTTEEELEVHIGDLFFYNHGWNERTNRAYYKLARKVVLSALERDDAEFVAKVKRDGALRLPSDFCDISREDILNGEYLLEEL